MGTKLYIYMYRVILHDLSFFFFFWEREFQPLLMIALYHQTKTLISFWCRWGLNLKSLVQPSETLSVELTGTHILHDLVCYTNYGKLIHKLHNDPYIIEFWQWSNVIIYIKERKMRKATKPIYLFQWYKWFK